MQPLEQQSARFKAWRFDVPTSESDVERAGLVVDFQGRVATVSGADSIRQALRLLISTARGERVMRPEYGCDLRRLAFSPMDDTTAGLAIHMVKSAVAKWEPRVEVLAVDAEPSADVPGILELTLDYRIRRTGQSEHMNLQVSLES